MDNDAIRRDQINAGRTANAGENNGTLHTAQRTTGIGNTERPSHGHRGSTGSSRPPRKPFVPKGHDAILSRMQEAGSRARIVTMAGEKYEGKITARDKFTITLLTDFGRVITFYKHGIESFEPAVQS